MRRQRQEQPLENFTGQDHVPFWPVANYAALSRTDLLLSVGKCLAA